MLLATPIAGSHPFGKHFARRIRRGLVYNVGSLNELPLNERR